MLSRPSTGALLAAVLLAAFASACTRAAPPDPEPQPPAPVDAAVEPPAEAPASAPARKVFALSPLGLSFEAPVTWTSAPGPRGVQVSPAADDPAASAAILVQALAGEDGGSGEPGQRLLAVKGQLLDELTRIDPAGKLLRTARLKVGEHEGLRLVTSFTHQGTRQRKDLVLLLRGGQILVVSCVAPDTQFAAINADWEHLVESLQLQPPGH